MTDKSLRALPSPSFLVRLALWAIRFYQRHLSPVKGFSCAYRAETGGASCSAHGYRVIQRRGVKLGLLLLQRRLERCGDTHRRLQHVRNPILHYQRGECDVLPCDGCGKGASFGQCVGELGCQNACDYGYSRFRRWMNAWHDRRARKRRRPDTPSGPV